MPHIIIEYSGNLGERLDVESFVRNVHDAAVATGVFARDAIRTRASERTVYRISDGHPDNAFVHVVLRMRPGRGHDAKQRVGETVFAAICNHLAPIYASRPLGVTFEMQEVDIENRFFKSNLEDYLKRREREPQVPSTAHKRQSMGNIEIHPIPLVGLVGRGEKAKFTHLFNHGQDVRFGYYVWFLEDDGKRILVDAGGTAKQATENWGRPKETVTHIQTLAEGLGKHHLNPSDIDVVILTHLHLDHMAYVKDLTNARFIVQEEELAFARHPHPADRFYDPSVLDGLNIDVVNGDTQITTGVRVVLTPGHTAGGQSVAIETAKGIAVITGFCCIQENFEPGDRIKKIMPVVVPGVHLDVIKAYDSMIKVRDMADILIPNHDAKFLDGAKIP